MLSIFSCAYWPLIYLLWRNVCSSPLPIFESDFFLLLLLLSFRSPLYILDINPFSDIWFSNIFSHSVGCLFILQIVSFDIQNLKFFIKFSLSIFFFCYLCFWCHVKKSLPNPISWSFYPMFSNALSLKFRSLNHFELIFVYGVR